MPISYVNPDIRLTPLSNHSCLLSLLERLKSQGSGNRGAVTRRGLIVHSTAPPAISWREIEYVYIYNHYTAEYNLLYKNFKKYLEFLKIFFLRLKGLYHIFKFCQDFRDIINTIVTFFAAFFLLLEYIFPIVTENSPIAACARLFFN